MSAINILCLLHIRNILGFVFGLNNRKKVEKYIHIGC